MSVSIVIALGMDLKLMYAVVSVFTESCFEYTLLKIFKGTPYKFP